MSEELLSLHSLVLEQCKESIILNPERLERAFDKQTEDQKLGIINYGYRYSEDAFMPHITIGRTTGEYDNRIIHILEDKLKDIPKEQTFDRITVYRMGANGTHAETLHQETIYTENNDK